MNKLVLLCRKLNVVSKDCENHHEYLLSADDIVYTHKQQLFSHWRHVQN